MNPLHSELVTPVYTMNVETDVVRQHGFHLGTQMNIAEQFVMEELRKPGVRSVALYFGRRLIHIYDWRDLPENEE